MTLTEVRRKLHHRLDQSVIRKCCEEVEEKINSAVENGAYQTHYVLGNSIHSDVGLQYRSYILKYLKDGGFHVEIGPVDVINIYW